MSDRAVAGPGSPRRRRGAALLFAALALLLISGAPSARAAEPFVPNFRTAPETIGKQTILAAVFVNGIDSGVANVVVDGDKITVPHASLEDLRLGSLASGALDLAPGGSIPYTWDPPTSTLRLTVSASALQALNIGVTGGPGIQVSPEAIGGWVNYDVNARRALGGSSGAGAGASNTIDLGAFAELHVTGPDIEGYSAWSYDSSRAQDNQPTAVRLNSFLMWRPMKQDLSAGVGDFDSTSTGAARSYGFLGVQVGTDHSAEPGFDTTPIPQLSGTAAAPSTLDIYINNQRISSAQTPGGPFTVNLPSGGVAGGARAILTDVTGKQVVVSLETPLVNADTIRQGLFLWSAGVGLPRFNYGTLSSDYLMTPYVYMNARYGLTNRLTLIGHGEGGAGLAEGEFGGNIAVSSGIALQLNGAGSISDRGSGGSATVAATIALPWGFSLSGSWTRATPNFEDVVSASGAEYAREHGTASFISEGAGESEALRLSWLAPLGLTVTGSLSRDVYPKTGKVGLASLSASAVWHGIPMFAQVSDNLGGPRNFTALAGVSLTLGGISLSASGGLNNGDRSGSLTASQGLQNTVGSVGWNVNAGNSAGQYYGLGTVEARSGYGIPGLQFDYVDGSKTAYATGRGSFGFVGGHPFVGDPITSGVVVADVGAPGVAVSANGAPQGRTSWDGKIALPAYPGSPLTAGIGVDTLPLNTVPEVTERAATVRDGGAAVVKFGVRDESRGAIVIVTDGGAPPPPGSTLTGARSSAPLNKRGRAFMPEILPNEVLVLTRPNGTSCTVATKFDGKGGGARRIGPFECVEKPQ